MKAHSLVLVAALASLPVALSPRDAAAQSAPATPSVAEQAAAPPTPVGIPMVRIHVRSYRDHGTARVYVHRTDGTYTLACTAPCTYDVPANAEMRATFSGKEDDSHSFIVPGDKGPEVDIEVRPPSAGPLVGSIVLMAAGGSFLLSGLLFVALADVSGTGRAGVGGGTNVDSDDWRTIGFVMLGVGAAAAAGGLVWLATRSKEPRVIDFPHANMTYGRTETVLGDVALGKPRDATTLVPAPSTPLRLGFTF